MLFLADMGISRTTVKWLRGNGHDAIHLRDQKLQQAKDPFILEKARSEGRILLTSDLGFGFLMAASNEKFPSVIILRLKNEKAQNQIERIGNVIDEAALSLLNGSIISVSEDDFRIRLTPINRT
jgi:predicted nuclease of predicted toxin-antitoxin system